jgi:hypothetical protein
MFFSVAAALLLEPAAALLSEPKGCIGIRVTRQTAVFLRLKTTRKVIEKAYEIIQRLHKTVDIAKDRGGLLF